MKRSLFLLGPLASIALIHSGCNASSAHAHQHDHGPSPAAEYKAGHGVRLTPPAREFAGLQTVEATPAGEFVEVPAAALLRSARGDFVYVENGDWFLRTPVEVASIGDTAVQIRQGLYEGDVVVSHGVSSLVLSEIQALNGGVCCADGH